MQDKEGKIMDKNKAYKKGRLHLGNRRCPGLMNIRKAIPNDAKKIIYLRKQTTTKTLKDHYTQKQINAANKINPLKTTLLKIKYRDVFVAVDENDPNQILGVIDFTKGKIGGLFVKYTHLNNQIGKKLMQFMETHAKKNNYKKIWLHSTINSTGFYEKLGYKQKKETMLEKNNVKYPVVIMEKVLR